MTAEEVIGADPHRVWAALTDFRALADASPELVAMLPTRPGGLRIGQRYVGINRRKAVLWPTVNRIDTVRAAQQLAWTTTSSGAHWDYTLTPEGDGTRVVLTRTAAGLPKFAVLIAKALLGGVAPHADEIEDGMSVTLDRLKVAVESDRGA